MIIREIDLFGGISDEIEEELTRVMEAESYNSGDMVFKEGDPANSFCVVQSGALKLKVIGARQTTHLAIRAGEAVGWSSLAGRDTYSATVECVEASKLIKINKDKLDHVLRRHPSTGLLFYKRLAKLVGERLIGCYQEMVKLQEERIPPTA